MVYRLPYGLGSAVSTRVGNGLGAGKPKAARVVIFLAVSEGLLISLITIAVRDKWGYMYSNEKEVVGYLASVMPVLASNFMDGVQGVLSGMSTRVARGCGWQKLGASVNMEAYYLVGLPCAITLTFGLWMEIIGGSSLQALVLLAITLLTNWDDEVQYRDMLRRFSAKVDEDYKLDIDMNGLRAKIFSLFGFSPDADLTLTYIDEDGDEVTLIDDDELHDVMNQELDFVMIYVVLNDEKWDKLPTSLSERVTALRYPRRPPTLAGLSSGCAASIAELLKSLLDPLLEELSRLALDAITKAASSRPLRMVRDPSSRSRSRLLNDAAAATSKGSNASKDETRPEELVKDATSKGSNNASKDEIMQDHVVPALSILVHHHLLYRVFQFWQATTTKTPVDENSKREEPRQIHNIKSSSAAASSYSLFPPYISPFGRFGSLDASLRTTCSCSYKPSSSSSSSAVPCLSSSSKSAATPSKSVFDEEFFVALIKVPFDNEELFLVLVLPQLLVLPIKL
ncbi:hypothetical protein FNV43_RR19682 [Rhamnella rubrinervis]|uniref:Protein DETOXIFICATION n=1 Tax=Rhamnella rubrinervis TaxID=2594499 RepID=A0A8K0GSN0_9ROSA|nr:hypothetical protein FNV43_RR19682 [Rhamnella rubrinervis]